MATVVFFNILFWWNAPRASLQHAPASYPVFPWVSANCVLTPATVASPPPLGRKFNTLITWPTRLCFNKILNSSWRSYQCRTCLTSTTNDFKDVFNSITNDFKDAFNFICQQLDPSYTLPPRCEEEIPKLVKNIHCHSWIFTHMYNCPGFFGIHGEFCPYQSNIGLFSAWRESWWTLLIE